MDFEVVFILKGKEWSSKRRFDLLAGVVSAFETLHPHVAQTHRIKLNLDIN